MTSSVRFPSGTRFVYSAEKVKFHEPFPFFFILLIQWCFIKYGIMKKQIVGILLGGMALLVLLSFNDSPKGDQEIPEEISSILKSSCYDCHSKGANSEKAQKAVQFDLWDDYRLTKKIGLLAEIGEVIEEGDMPPKKYLEHKPDRKLTESQKTNLVEWTKKESERLMKGE